jgi:hypothetical protein
MDEELYVVERIDADRSLCISPLSRKLVVEADAGHLGDKGFFVYELDERPLRGGIQILAKAVSLEAAFRLIDIFRAMQGDAPKAAHSHSARG